ncbi:MAG: sulfite exporter TauE/SafE family protein [bacterium]|nr:sulfite exporter TauE/SafE family protein [bacterium]
MEYFLISLLGLAMGIVTSISGGSGVFAVPAMLAFGLPPLNVLALNRMSDVGVVTGALRKYQKSENIDWSLALRAMIPMSIGSAIGASFVVSIPEHILTYVIFSGIFIGIFFLLRKPSPVSALHRPSASWWGFFFLFLVGIWGGALAIAGATFAVLVLVNFFGKSYLQARATDVAAAIPETFISSAILTTASTVQPGLLFVMFASSFVGAWIGSHLAVRHGSAFIRRAMVGVAMVMIVKVFFDLI